MLGAKKCHFHFLVRDLTFRSKNRCRVPRIKVAMLQCSQCCQDTISLQSASFVFLAPKTMPMRKVPGWSRLIQVAGMVRHQAAQRTTAVTNPCHTDVLTVMASGSSFEWYKPGFEPLPAPSRSTPFQSLFEEASLVARCYGWCLPCFVPMVESFLSSTVGRSPCWVHTSTGCKSPDVAGSCSIRKW